jgi:hypothetical protein
MDNEFTNSMSLIKPKELTHDRFVQESGLSKEEAKKIALANGVIWDVI